jgi:predicted amidohydrolase
MLSSQKFKVALCQLKTLESREHNLKRAEKMIREAAQNQADLIMLPEMFTTPYVGSHMLANKEPIDDFKTNPAAQTTNLLSSLAKELGKYIIGGSIPETIEGKDKIYNTCLCFDREGEIAAKHRK